MPCELAREEVAVGVHAATEVEVVAGIEREVGIREDAELEDRHRDGLDFAAQPDFRAGRSTRR